MAIISKKLKSGISYVVRVRDRNFKWYPSKVFERKIDAEIYERQLLNLRDNGEEAKSKETRSLTVHDYVNLKWANDCRSKASRGWKTTQEQMLRDYVLPVLGKRKLVDVKPEDVGRVLREMEKIGRGNQTRRHVYNMLHHIFEAASQYHNLIPRNPVLKRDKPDLLPYERTTLKPAQAIKLLEASLDSYVCLAVWIGILAGLRPNEIQAVTWGAIDFDTNLIRIKSGFKRSINDLEPYPKQKKHGSVPMIDALRRLLFEKSKGKNPSDFVIPGLRGRILSYGTFLVHLKSLCRSAGLPEITPHELRHSCTEIWCANGASEEDIVRLLNHSGSGSVRRYIHETPDRILKIAQGIEIPVHSFKSEQSEHKNLHIVK